MNNNKKYKNLKYIFVLALTILCIGGFGTNAFAEGSADMVKSAYNGTTTAKTPNQGNRSFIWAAATKNWVGLSQNQQIRAYAYEGEKLYVAASVYSNNDYDIEMTLPDGTVQRLNSTESLGYIKNLAAETKGPNGVIQPEAAAAAHIADLENVIMPAAHTDTEFGTLAADNGIQTIAGATTGGYTAHVIEVKQSGVYNFKFRSEPLSTGGSSKVINDSSDFITQQQYSSNTGSTNTLAAFDITVTDNANNVQKGRVYSDLFALQTSGAVWQHYYIATRDGYIYNLSMNGAMPYTYFLFSNNRGLIGSATNASVYHSIKDVNNDNNFDHYKNLLNRYGNADGTYVMGPDNDPTDLDYAYHMFFNYPDKNLPEFVLAKPKAVGEVTSIRFEGEKADEDSDVGYSGDGGYFIVTTNNASSYRLIIDMSNMYVKKGTAGYSGAAVNVEKTGGNKGNYTVTPSVQGHLDEIKLSTDTDLNFIYEDTNTGQWYSIKTTQKKTDGSWDQNPGGGADAAEYVKITKPSDLSTNYQTLGVVMLGNSSKSDDPAAENKIFWNGRDQYGRVLPAGSYFGNTGRGKVYAQAKAGELHFPLIDCETIPNGLSVFLENPPEGNTNYDTVAERSKLYYNNKNDSLLRQGDNIAAIKGNWPTGSGGANWDATLANKLEYMWRINQNNTYATVISDDYSIDGISTYDGTSADDKVALKVGSYMKASDNLGVDHGISDTWTYILNDAKVEMKTEAKDGALTLYSEPQEKILKGFVFFDTQDDGANGSYDKKTNDTELPKCRVEAFYGNVTFTDEKTENGTQIPRSATGYVDTVTDNTGNYSIPIKLATLNSGNTGGKIYIKVSPPDDTYKLTTKNNAQVVDLKAYTKSTYASNVGYTRVITDRAIRIQTLWTPAALKTSSMSVSFDALGYDENDLLGGDSMGNVGLVQFSNNGSRENELESKESIQEYKGISVSAADGNQTTKDDFVGIKYSSYLDAEGHTVSTEQKIAYVVKQNSSGSGFKLSNVEYDPSFDINGDGSRLLYNWTFTNEVLPARINETVWHDADRDGTKDSEETDLTPKNIKISKRNDRGVYEGFTAVPAGADEMEKETGVTIEPDKEYTLEYINGLQLPAGTYKLIVPPGDDTHIYCTNPGTKTGDGTLTASIDPETGYSVQEITVNYGQTININVGYAVGSSIKGIVFIDSVTDGIMNGTMDSEEAAYRNKDIEIKVVNAAKESEVVFEGKIGDEHGEYKTSENLKAVPYKVIVKNPGITEIDPDKLDDNYMWFSIPTDNSEDTGTNADGVQYTRDKTENTLSAIVPTDVNDGISSTHEKCDIPLQRPFTVVYNAGAYHDITDGSGDKTGGVASTKTKTTKAWYADNAVHAAPDIDEIDGTNYVTLGWAEITQEPGLVSNWTRDDQLDIIPIEEAGTEQKITRDMTFYAVAAADNYGKIGTEGENTGKHIGDDIPDYMQVIYDGNKPEGADGTVANVPTDTNKYPNPNVDEAKATVTVKLEATEIPSLKGYTFMGWAKDSISTTADYPYPKADGKTTFVLPDEGEILYAVWSKQYNVTYDMNKKGDNDGLVDGASGTAPTDKDNHLFGDLVKALAPTGVKTASEKPDNYDDESIYDKKGNNPIFVGWSIANQALFNLSQANKDLVDTLKVQNVYSLTEEDKQSLRDKKVTEADILEYFKMPDSGVSLFAMWAEDLNGTGVPDYLEDYCTLNYDLNITTHQGDTEGGNLTKELVIPEGGTFVKGQNIIPAPYNTYYRRDEDGNNLTPNVICVGWSKTQYTEPLLATATDDEKNSIIGDNFRIMGNTILYATYAVDENNNGKPDYADNAVSVDYYANGGTINKEGTTGKPSGEDAKDWFYNCGHHHAVDTETSLISVDAAKDYISKEDCVLIGWSDTPKDTVGKLADPDEVSSYAKFTVTIPKEATSNVKVYAVWAEDTNGNGSADYAEQHYTLTYSGNTHTDATGLPVPAELECIEGEVITLPVYETEDKLPKAKNVVFLGWSHMELDGEVKVIADFDRTSNVDKVREILFKGYFTRADELNAVTTYTMPARDVILRGVWADDKNLDENEPPNEMGNGTPDYRELYTVRYNPSKPSVEEENNIVPTDEENKIPGDRIEIAPAPYSGLSAEGYVQIGWSKKNEPLLYNTLKDETDALEAGTLLKGSTKYILDGNDAADDTNVINLYSVWAYDRNGNGQPDYNEDNYTVTFDMQGGRVSADVEKPEDITGIANQPVQIPEYKDEPKPVKDNAIFVGWSTSADDYKEEPGLTAQPEEGRIIENPYRIDPSIANDDKIITLYAVWARDTVGKLEKDSSDYLRTPVKDDIEDYYQVIYDGNVPKDAVLEGDLPYYDENNKDEEFEGVIRDYHTTKYEVGQNVDIIPNNLSIKGYRFRGWSLNTPNPPEGSDHEFYAGPGNGGGPEDEYGHVTDLPSSFEKTAGLDILYAMWRKITPSTLEIKAWNDLDRNGYYDETSETLVKEGIKVKLERLVENEQHDGSTLVTYENVFTELNEAAGGEKPYDVDSDGFVAIPEEGVLKVSEILNSDRYRITYKIDEGSPFTTQTSEGDTPKSYVTGKSTNDPERDDAYEGLNEKGEFSIQFRPAEGTNVIAYGQLVKDTNVKYDINGGTGTTPVDSDSHLFGEVVTLKGSEEFNKANSIFVGWSTVKHEENLSATMNKELVEALKVQNIYQLSENDKKTPEGEDKPESEWQNQFKMPDENVTLYALWADNINGNDKPDYDEDKYTVVFNYNGGTDMIGIPVQDETHTDLVENAEVHVPTAAEINGTGVEFSGRKYKRNDNEIFVGWSFEYHATALTSEERDEAERLLVKDLTEDNMYKVAAKDDADNDKTITLYALWAKDDNDNNSPDYGADNHISYNANGGTLKEGAPLPGAHIPDENGIFFACSHHHPVGVAVELLNVDDANANIQRDGAVVVGWSRTKHDELIASQENEDSNKIKNNTLVIESSEEANTVYALWAEDKNKDGTADYKQYSVTYNGNGETSGSVPVDERSPYSAGDKVTVLGNVGKKSSDGGTMVDDPLKKNHAVFVGWTADIPIPMDLSRDTKPEDVEKLIVHEFNMPAQNRVLYALWAADSNGNGTPDYSEDDYRVVFNGNGGEYAQDESKTPAPLPVENLRTGDTVSIPISPYPGLQKTAAVQIGWSNAEAVNGRIYDTALPIGITVYQTNELYTVIASDDANNDKTINIYAVWAKDENSNGKPDYEEKEYSLTYDMNGGKAEDMPSPSIIRELIDGVSSVELHKYDKEAKPSKKANAVNAVFIGWSLEKQSELFTKAPEEGVMLGTLNADAQMYEGSYKVSSSDADDSKNITVYAAWAEDRNENGTPDYAETQWHFTVDFNGGLDAEDQLVPQVTRDVVYGQLVHIGELVNHEYVLQNYHRYHTVDTPNDTKAVFVGWSSEKHEEVLGDTAADKANAELWTLNNDEILIEKDGTTVYALWAVDKDGNKVPDYDGNAYNVIYYANGGVSAVPEQVTVDPETEQFHTATHYYAVGDEATDILPTSTIRLMVKRDKAVAIGLSQTKHDIITSAAQEEAAKLIVVGTDTGLIIQDPSLENPDPNAVYVVWAQDENNNTLPDYNEGPFHVYYDKNANADEIVNGTVPTDSAEYNYDQLFPVLANDAKNAEGDEDPLKLEGAVWIGWSINQQTFAYTRTADSDTVDLNTIAPSTKKGDGYDEDTMLRMGDKDVTLYAVWAEDKNENGIPDYKENYKLEYVINEGSGDVPPSVTDKIPGDTIDMADPNSYSLSLTKEKAVLVGWSHHKFNENFTQDPHNSEELVSDHSTIPGDIPSELKIKDDIFGTSYTVNAKDVNADGKTIPAFAVWAADSNGNGIPDYEDGYYNIVYDLNADVDTDKYGDVTGTVPDILTEQLANTDVYLYKYTEGKPVRNADADHIKAVFVGWSLTKHNVFDKNTTPTDIYEEGEPYHISSADALESNNIKFYAVWAEDTNGNDIPDYSENKYKVVYNMGNHTEFNAPEPHERIAAGTDVILKNVPQDKYANLVFIGWTTDKDLITGNDYGRGAVALPTLHKPGSSYTIGDPTILPDTDNEEFIFYALWAADENDNGTADYEELYTLHYNINGGTGTLPRSPERLIPGENITIASVPFPGISWDSSKTPDKAVHIGWSIDRAVENKIYDEDSVTEVDGVKVPAKTAADGTQTAIKLYGSQESYIVNAEDDADGNYSIECFAVWAVDVNDDGVPDYNQNIHHISYDLNGHSDGTNAIPDSEARLQGEVIKVTKDIPKADGVVFLRWTTFAGVEDFDKRAHPSRVEAIESVTEVTMPDSDVTLYAVWADDDNRNGIADYLETYTFTYNANGGAGNCPINIEYVIPGDEINLSAVPYAGLSRENSVQTGWSLESGDNKNSIMESPYIVPDVEKPVDDTKIGARVITAYAVWETDENGNNGVPDGIPDRYQKKVTFRIENGTWKDTGRPDDIVLYAELKDGDKWSESGKGSITAPIPTPNYGYTNGTWYKEGIFDTKLDSLPEYETGTDEVVYKYVYEYEQPVDVSYKPYREGMPLAEEPTSEAVTYGTVVIVDPNGGVWKPDKAADKIENLPEMPEGGFTELTLFRVQNNITIREPEPRENYIFLGWKCTENAETPEIDYIYTAQWAEDTVGMTKEGTIGPDNIPDMYQKKVVFKIVKGTWDSTPENNANKIGYVTLTKKDELLSPKTLWAVDGEGYMTDALGDGSNINIVPDTTSAVPDGGYTEKDGEWYPELPSDYKVKGIADVSYSFIFLDQTNPNTVYKENVYSKTDSDIANESFDYEDSILIDPAGGEYEGKAENQYFVLRDRVIQLSDPVWTGHVFMGWIEDTSYKAPEPEHFDVVCKYTASWADDVLGDNGSDGIPDKSEAAVTFDVINGTWKDTENADTITRYAELLDNNGKWIDKDKGQEGTGSINNIPEPTADTGFDKGLWSGLADGVWTPMTPVRNVDTLSTKVYAYKYTYEPVRPIVTYTGFTGAQPNADTQSEPYSYNDKIKICINDENADHIAYQTLTEDYTLSDAVREGYVFMGWQYEAFSGTDNTEGIAGTYTAMWEADGTNGIEPDGIPDRYQQDVIYHITGGIWSVERHGEDLVRYYELTDNEGKWSESGSAILTEPEHEEIYGYTDKGKWDTESGVLPESITKQDMPYEFTYIYEYKADLRITYPEYVEGRIVSETQPIADAYDDVPYGKHIIVDTNGGAWRPEWETEQPDGFIGVKSFTVEENMDLGSDLVKEGNIFLGWSRMPDDVPTEEDYVYTAQWAEDISGKFDTNGNPEPDGIPDMYQKKVEFRIVNGTWSDDNPKVIYAELKDNDNNWSRMGSADISAEIPDILKAVPQAGYMGGTWYPYTPSHIVSGIEDELYSYIFMDETNPNVVYKSAVYNRNLSDMSMDSRAEGILYDSRIIIDTDGGDYPDRTEKQFSVDMTVDQLTFGVYTLKDPTKTGNVFMGWKSEEYTDTDDNKVVRKYTALWLEDTKGDNGVSDGIPDKYQKSVTFVVVNGKWVNEPVAVSDDTQVTRYAELKDNNGNWSEMGTGSIAGIPVSAPNTGYSRGGWNEEPVLSFTGSVPKTYIYSYDIINTYNVIYDGYTGDSAPQQKTDSGFSHFNVIVIDTNGGTLTQSGMVDNSITISGDVTLNRPVKNNSVFMGWLGEKFTDENNANVVYKYTAMWLSDGTNGIEPDGIPDEFQKKVIFTIKNGYWNDTEGLDEITEYVELKDADGKWNENAVIEIDVPTSHAEYGYSNGKWTNAPDWVTDESGGKAQVTGRDTVEYSYSYESVELTVSYRKYSEGSEEPVEESDIVPYGKHIFVNPNGGTWTQAGITEGTVNTVPITVTEDITLSAPVRDGYLFEGWSRTPKDDLPTADYTYTAQWLANGNGDDIPDIYQKKIEFRIINGNWASGDSEPVTAYVTLTENGKWSINGTAEIPQSVLDRVSAPIGYNGYIDRGWYPALPKIISGTDMDVFTYIFSAPNKYNPVYKSAVHSLTSSDMDIKEVSYGEHIIVRPMGGTWTHDGSAAEYVTVDGMEYRYDVTDTSPNVDAIEDPYKANSVFMGWNVTSENGIHTFTAQWADDYEGEYDAEGNKTSDGIPDKFQRAVTFDILNGTWTETGGDKTIVRYAEIKDSADNWSENGTGMIDNVPMPQPNTGYTTGAWTPAEPVRAVDTANDTEPPVFTEHNMKIYACYTYTYEIDRPIVTYDRYMGNTAPVSDSDTYEYNSNIKVVTNGGKLVQSEITVEDSGIFAITEDMKLNIPEKEGSVFMGWISEDSSEEGIERIYTAQWMTDEEGIGGKPDGIPDEYQKKIIFHVVNGTWIDTSTEDIVQYYELIDKATGMWSENGNGGPIDCPKPAVLYGYVGKWTPPVPKEAVGNGTDEYTYMFTERPGNSVLYQSYNEGTLPPAEPDEYVELDYGGQILIKPNGGVWTSPLSGLKYSNDTSVVYDEDTPIDIVNAPDERMGYVFMGWDVAVGEDRSGFDFIFTAQWLEDTVGDTDADGNDISDGIPDIYQKKVTLRVDKGEWAEGGSEDKTVYVELRSENDSRRWSTNGVGTLQLPQGMIPDEGHTDKEGSWDIANDGTSAVVHGNAPETFTYSYDVNVYTVVFHTTDMSSDEEFSITAVHGETITAPAPPAPAEYYYEFTGWMNDSDGTFVLTGESITVTENMSFTAQWNVNSSPVEPTGAAYMVEHYLQQLDGSYSLENTEMLYGDIGSEVTASAVAYEGYTYNVEISQSTGIVFAPVIKDGEPTVLVLKLYYDIEKYGVTYDLRGGFGGPDKSYMDKTYPVGERVDLWAGIPRIDGGAVFIGWSTTEPEGIATDDSVESTLTERVEMVSGGVIVYAVWAVDVNNNGIPDYRERHYTLTYDGNGNTDGDVPVDEREYVQGERAVLKNGNTLVKEGCVFVGWSENQYVQIFSEEQGEDAESIIIQEDTYEMPSMDVTLYAVWATDANGNGNPDYNDDAYHVEYYSNGGYDEDGDGIYYICNHHHAANTEVELMDISYASDLTMENAILIGWSEGQYGIVNTQEDYSSIEFATTVMITDRNAIVNAVWAADINHNNTPDYMEERYRVDYDLNGGEGGPDNETLTEEYLAGENVTLWNDSSQMYKENSVFLGWGKAKMPDFVYAPDETLFVTEVTMQKDGVTVYAVWAVDRNNNGTPDYYESTYRLTYDGNGNTQGDVPTDDKEYLEGEAADVQGGGNLKRTDTVFIGWSESQNSVFTREQKRMAENAVIGDTYTMPADNVTLYAAWADDVNGNGIPDYDDSLFTISYAWADGTVPENAVLPKTVYILQGMSFTPESPANVGGYIFSGWFKDKAAANEYTGGTVTSDMILYGKWTYQSSTPSGGGGGGGGGGSTTYYTISAAAMEGGTISPEGETRVMAGSNKTFDITPAQGYKLKYLAVDGEKVQGELHYTFENIRKDHVIMAFFERVEDKSEDNRPSEEDTKPSEPTGGKSVAELEETGVGAMLNAKDHTSYFNGYTDGTFAPDSNITRAEVAQMFYNLLIDKDIDISVSFDDVNENAWYAKAVNTLASLDILAGVGHNEYAPERNITRAEFTAIAMRFAKLDESGENIFSDVSEGAWYYGSVVGSIKYGWISGYNDGTFRPLNTITRAETATIVNRMLYRSADKDFIDNNGGRIRSFADLDSSHWAYLEIMEAANAHTYNRTEKEVWTELVG